MSYLLGAYAFALVALGVYVVSLVRRSRSAAARLREHEREHSAAGSSI